MEGQFERTIYLTVAFPILLVRDVLKSVLMVGECLARLGTWDGSADRSNASRAINTRDYAQLLKMVRLLLSAFMVSFMHL